MKTCSKCKQEKEFSEFYKSPGSKDGYHTQCITCKHPEVKRHRGEIKPLTGVSKTCTQCDQVKDKSLFRKDPCQTDGYRPYCSKCDDANKAPLLKKRRAAKKAKRVAAKQSIIDATTKVCTKCGVEKSKEEFSKSKHKTSGCVSQCKACVKIKAQIYYADNKDKIAGRNRAWVLNSRDHLNHLKKTRYKANRVYHSARRRAISRHSVPPWLTKEQEEQIQNFYRVAQHMTEFHEEAYEVDHIEPLIGKTSCGLTVPWNLRVIHWKENRSKGNKLITT